MMTPNEPSASSGQLPLHVCLDKVPPGWNPAAAGRYTFKAFKRDFFLWKETTSLEDHKIGPALALRLGGTPKEIALSMMEAASNVAE